MSYIDAIHDKDANLIQVVERINGERVFKSNPVDYSFYVSDPRGKYTSIYRTPVTKITPKTSTEFYKELSALKGKKLFESDINYVYKCLSQNYKDIIPPNLHVTFLDIEVSFDPEKGYSSPDDPFNIITAITVHCNWLDKLITLAIPPKTITFEDAQKIADKFDDTFIYESEAKMLDDFLNIVSDSDIITGWNSGGFDLPYLINRIAKVMSKDDTKRLCLWNNKPKARKYEKFGKEQNTYDLVGIVHMDYMDIYRKFTYEERHSYSLNAIAEHELGKSKTPYEGSLDKLYNEDFEKFIDYNRQDVRLIVDMDYKLKLISLINALAHKTTTLIANTLGQVVMTDQAIINHAHEMGFVVPNKDRSNYDRDESEDEGAVGAYVAYPKKGLKDWIGVIDINSLYPSAIRALNMGPETIIGQLKPVMTESFISTKMKQPNTSFAKAWEGIFGSLEYQSVMNKEKQTDITIEWEDGKVDVASAAEINQMIFDGNQPWMLSANGTIFRYDFDAVIPILLSKWYTERKELQKKKKEATDHEQISYYDRMQHVAKIQLNAAYGALLNRGCRFNDKRIGQSVTLCGRVIVKHMNSHINEAITGEYQHDGEAIIYADTDSSQFSAWPTIQQMVANKELKWDKDVAVNLYSTIAEGVNDSWTGFMKRAFHCPEKHGNIIRGGFESLGEKGLYITKKRYAILNYYLDGKRLDLVSDGKLKLKAMGLDLRRADTPVICQKFLADILGDLLHGKTIQSIIDKITIFKAKFHELPVHEKGTPKRVNKLTYYSDLIKKGKGNRVPGHVRASINWNTLKRINNDNYSITITDGMKVIVCQLKDNPIGYTSVAYPIDEQRLPKWYIELPFDSETMEAAVVDKKIENLLSQLDEWDDIKSAISSTTTFNDFFSLI